MYLRGETFMPFTPKLKADYIEMINQSLDSIRLESVEDFKLVRNALEAVIKRESNATLSVEEKYKENIFFINDYLKEPGDYVADEKNYIEYEEIIKGRIEVKIEEFDSLDTQQKEQYIQNQHDRMSEVSSNQQIMSQRRLSP